jgi:dTMP kinase
MRLIIVDGLDGVGKDTHAKLIKDRYEEMGEKVALRSHPESDNFFGKKAKKALLGKGKINRLKASVFYMVDVLRSIKKYYGKKEYDTLIMVRYLMGTAYLPQRLAKIAYDLFENFVPTSDYMFFLDASPTKLLKRFEERDELEMFETLDELVKVRKKTLLLAESWNIIDTTGTVEATFSHIENVLEKIDNKT